MEQEQLFKDLPQQTTLDMENDFIHVIKSNGDDKIMTADNFFGGVNASFADLKNYIAKYNEWVLINQITDFDYVAANNYIIRYYLYKNALFEKLHRIQFVIKGGNGGSIALHRGRNIFAVKKTRDVFEMFSRSFNFGRAYIMYGDDTLFSNIFVTFGTSSYEGEQAHIFYLISDSNITLPSFSFSFEYDDTYWV